MIARIISLIIFLVTLIASVFFAVKIIKLYQHEHQMAIKQVSHIKSALESVYQGNEQLAPQDLMKKFLAVEYREDLALMILDNQGRIVASPNQKFIGLPVSTFSKISTGLTSYIQDYLTQKRTEKINIVHDLGSNLEIISAIWRLNKSHSLLMLKRKSSVAYFDFLNKKQHLFFLLTLSIGILIISIVYMLLHDRLLASKLINLQLALFCLMVLILIFQLILFRTPDQLPSKFHILHSKSRVQALIDKEEQSQNKALLLPFGVYITHINFPTEATVGMSMWLWSKKVTLNNNDMVNILLTQKIKGEEMPVKTRPGNLMYRLNQIEIKQNFSQTRYPFDDRYIVIEFWHTHIFDPNIIIYPDLDSYNLSNPNDFLTPQLDPNVQIKDWNILESFYAAAPLYSNSELGYPQGSIEKLPNRIMLVILLRRDFTGPLMKFFLPLLVVLVMYFIGLLLMSENSIFSTLTYNASLLFVITLAASQARQYVATNNISFIEVMYIIVYSTIVLFSLLQLSHTYLNHISRKISIHDMLKFVYWPCVLAAVLFNTVAYFW